MLSHAPSSLIDHVERIRSCSGLDGREKEREWFDIVRLTPAEYRKFLSSEMPLPELSVRALCEKYGISYRQLREGQIDFREISLRNSPPAAPLPERYAVAAFGRARTTIHALNFLEKNNGWRRRTELLRKYRMSEHLFTDPMGSISHRFISDICRELSKTDDYADRDFYRMGAYSAVARQNPGINAFLRQSRSPAEMYERLFGEIMSLFERNCSYKVVSADESHCVVEVRDTREIAEAMGVRHLGNPQICALKAGWMAAKPSHLGLPFASVVETRCVHRGDSCCRFEIRFEEAAMMMA